jgi:tRNAThr (cytosine32-N3)-methyltransferase
LVLLFHRPCARAVDELALLFTGSPAPPTAQETFKSETTTEVDEGNGDDDGEEEECEVPTKDDVPASSHIPPSLDPSFTSPGDPSGHSIHPSLRDPNALGLPHPLFTIEQLGVDRRLIVNRKRQLKMYRVWMQGKFQRTETNPLPLVMEPDKSHP